MKLLLFRLVIPVMAVLFLALPVAAQDPTPESLVEPGVGPAEPPVLGRVVGVVENMTPDAAAPSGIPVQLYALENFEPIAVYTDTVTSDGSFVFNDVALVEGLTYIATVDYQNVAYGSTFFSYEGGEEEIRLDIEAYEATSDQSFITISRMHVIVEFVADNIRISELYVFDNTSDRVYVGASSDPNNGTIELPLPAGALNAEVERGMGDSMVPTSNSVLPTQAGFRDTLPVRPGTSTQQLMVTYELPYPQAVTVAHELVYPVKSVSLFVPAAGLEIASDVLSSRGQQAMGGMLLVQWDAADLAVGETLSFQISGEPDMSGVLLEDTTGTSMGTSSSGATDQTASRFSVSAGDNAVTWGRGIGALVVAAGLVAFLWSRQPRAPELAPKDKLLQALVALEDAHAAGEIPTGRYEQERERIKSELSAWYDD